jgi:hypothetical protein
MPCAQQSGSAGDHLNPTGHNTMQQRYQLYLTFADDGQGRDITRGLAPLLTFPEWLAA